MRAGTVAATAILAVSTVGAADAAGSQEAPSNGQNRAFDSCTGHQSNLWAPKTIRVLTFGQHDASGRGVPGTEEGVQTVPFRTYVENSLAAEWRAGWPPQALQAGAMAVQAYGWYWTQHWRGGTFDGHCYDVDDSINYQRYIPGSATPATNQAVADTWDTLLWRNGRIADTNYRATLTGDHAEQCGDGLPEATGRLSQFGSRHCALTGKTAEDIVQLYYPNVRLR